MPESRTNHFLPKLTTPKKIRTIKRRRSVGFEFDKLQATREGNQKEELSLPKIEPKGFLSPDKPPISDRPRFISPKPRLIKKVKFIDEIESPQKLAEVVIFSNRSNKSSYGINSPIKEYSKPIISRNLRNEDLGPMFSDGYKYEGTNKIPNIEGKSEQKLKLKYPLLKRNKIKEKEKTDDKVVFGCQSCLIY